MKSGRIFLSAVLAGLSIGFGGLVFLSVENRVMGAFLFAIGLFCVCTMGFHLFTGKVCYVLQIDRSYALSIPIIWLGNLVGTGLVAGAASLTRIGPAVRERAAALCAVKTGDSLVSLFFLGVLCNIFIYIAVEGYKSNPHPLGKYLALVLGVMVFILCGTEHCVADMFYFSMAGAWSVRAVVCLVVITVGNAAGGIAFAWLHGIHKK
ncbi:MAG: formate/nitrite transporter family protein [Oscillospiraceae bacterium]|nr:formate/nitrite transporter family protein [Oscillospiraceae bacterium]